jgi:hypothetical protein
MVAMSEGVRLRIEPALEGEPAAPATFRRVALQRAAEPANRRAFESVGERPASHTGSPLAPRPATGANGPSGSGDAFLEQHQWLRK